jgi:diguanylate cyclase (GGDEF)-like protein
MTAPADRSTRPSVAKLASSHLVSTCATFAAMTMFVFTASRALTGDGGATGQQTIVAAVFLNVALLLFTWRRSRDLKAALAACGDAEARAHENAYVDHVTGLGNRRQLVLAIDGAVRRGSGATLLLLDLDHFKKVNDLYGHSVGDRLLAFVGETLVQLTPKEAQCARLGGDEFAVLLPGRLSLDEVTSTAQAILTRLAQPAPLGSTVAHISASVGISSLDEAADAASLLRRSDIAMYEAKRLGRNCHVWFDEEMELQLDRRSQVEAEMRSGIAASEFVPFYQPQYSLGTGELTGFEVLARWEHPARGLLEPVEFIGIAEASGLIAQLSMNVMRQALVETKSWPCELTIAVNISPVQFRDPLLAQRILKLIDEVGFPAARLELEITESSILEDNEQASMTVASLKSRGISISLDDFGTGYASLTQLKALPFDRIKIDKSFVAALLSDNQSSAIVTTIAALGRSLHLPVTAEGVESEDVRTRLQSLGCEDGQGWLWGKAVPADVARAMLPHAPQVAPAVQADLTGQDEERSPVERRDNLRRARMMMRGGRT